MEKERKTERMTVRVTPTLKREYDTLADSLGLDIAACMSMALTEWLANQKTYGLIKDAVLKTMTTPEGIDVMMKYIDRDQLPDMQLALPLDDTPHPVE